MSGTPPATNQCRAALCLRLWAPAHRRPVPRRLLTQARPLDPIADVPERSPHAQRHQLVSWRPANRPIREQLHQLRVKPHRPSPSALRLPHQERRRIPRVIQVPPLKLEDLGDPQAGSPHDERRRPGPMAIVSGQGIQKPLNLVRRPVMRHIHDGRIHLDELCQKRLLSSISPSLYPALEQEKWQSLESNSAIDIQTPDPTVTLPTALKPNLHPQVLLQNRTKGQSIQLRTGYHS